MNVPSLKHRIRSCLDLIAYKTGLLQLFENRMRRGLTILMYHRVLPIERCVNYPLESLVIPTEIFQEQMRWLADHCHVLPVQDALVSLNSKRNQDRPLVSVTFDDGYFDNFEIAAPILEKFGLRGTFFVATDFIEDRTPLWYDVAAEIWRNLSPNDQKTLLDHLTNELGKKNAANKQPSDIQSWMANLKAIDPKLRNDILKEAESLANIDVDADLYRPMSIHQIADLSNRGHEIGSHTITHPILPQIDDSSLRHELELSAQKLTAWTGKTIQGFCYPNGDYDERIENAVSKAGYRYACTSSSGLTLPADRLTKLSRLSITMQRTMRADHTHDPLGFRSEISRFRELWR